MIKAVGAYTVPKLVSYGLNFLMIPFLTRVLSPADFGVVALAWALQNALASICSLWLPGAVSRYYFEYRHQVAELSALIVTTKRIVLLLFPFWALLMWFGQKKLALLIGVEERHGDVFFWTFIAAYVNQINGFYLNLFQNMERPYVYSLWLSVQTVVTVAVTMVAVGLLGLSSMGMIYGSLFGGLAAWAGSCRQLREYDRGAWRMAMARENVLYGLSVCPKSLTSFVNRFFDKYLLNNIHSLSTVGVYNVGQSMVNALSTGLNSVQSAFQPRWFKEIFDDPDKARQHVGRSFFFFSFLCFIPMMLSVILAKPLITFALPAAYHGLIQNASVMMLGLAGQIFGMFVGVQYAYTKKAFLLFPLTIATMLINVVSNIVLIPKFGIIGAAWSWVFSSYGGNLLMTYVGQRVFRIDYPWFWLCMKHAALWLAVLGVIFSQIIFILGAVILFIWSAKGLGVMDYFKEFFS